jgi:hypothetical protein
MKNGIIETIRGRLNIAKDLYVSRDYNCLHFMGGINVE